jgi:hypothetical protein
MSEKDQNYLYEFEKSVLGYEPKDLKGQVFLKSNLLPFQSFLSQWSVQEEVPQSLYLSLPLSAWTQYAKFLVEHTPLERQNLQQAIQELIDFVVWLKKEHLPDLNTTNIQMALKFGQKEIERGLILKKHLKSYLSKISAPPLQAYDLNSIEMELSWMQFQGDLEETEPYYGEYELITKDSEHNKAFFQAIQNEQKVVLPFPDTIFDHLQKGDRFHFEYDESPHQHQRFKNIEYIFPDFELEA